MYLLVVSSLVAFIAFVWLLEHVSATKVSTYAYVNPLIAVLLGTFLHDEPISTALIAGTILILIALFLVRGGERPLRTGSQAQANQKLRPLPISVPLATSKRFAEETKIVYNF